MTENELDSSIAKIVDYAKDKKQITWDELNELLDSDTIKDVEKMSKIYNALQEHSILFVEDDGLDEDDMLDDETEVEDDDVKDIESDRKRMVYNDKTSTSDDPIKLYLREIGKEHLLTAEQEVELSKEMEDGENIIKDVIKHSGMMIPEFYAVAQKAFSRIDIHEAGKPRKEINEESNLVEIIEYKNHPFFIACQFHPEFKSRPTRPHPLFNSFIKAASK